MGMAATQTPDRWTVAMLHALPDDGRRHEIIDGELLVTPSPTYAHQWAVLALYRRLDAYLRGNRAGYVLTAPADVRFDALTVVQPDLFVVPQREGGRPMSWDEAGGALLTVEVLSPASAAADRVRKRALYQRQGVPEYWIVDLDARVIERWRPADERPEILNERLAWAPEGAAEPMTIELREFWREAFEG